MKLEDLERCTANSYDGHFPPDSDWRSESGKSSVDLSGPREEDGDLVITVTSYRETTSAYLPVAVLANHLRLAGWTVTPPGES